MTYRCTSLFFAAALACAPAATLAAQDAVPYAPKFNMSTYAGASIPTGNLRDAFDTGVLLGAQGNYDLNSHLGLLGNFDWTHPTTKLVAGDDHANIYQADLGLEVGGIRGSARRWAMRPFADIGGGVRRYNYSGEGLSDHTGGVGFAALGTEVAVGRSAIRLAATDNVFSYESPSADATRATRNDVGLSLGFGFHP